MFFFLIKSRQINLCFYLELKIPKHFKFNSTLPTILFVHGENMPLTYSPRIGPQNKASSTWMACIAMLPNFPTAKLVPNTIKPKNIPEKNAVQNFAICYFLFDY